MKNNLKSVTKIIKDMPLSKFTNEYGEPFTIYSNGNAVFMSGSEVDMMVDDKDKIDGILPLFNPAFSIWSKDELWKLGEALQDVALQNGYQHPADQTFEYRGYTIFARVEFEGHDLYAIDEDGKHKAGQSLGDTNLKTVWYEVYNAETDELVNSSELKTLEDAKSLVDHLQAS
jgi:hypothetical protein